jgi:glycosyltransferase-like protein
LLVVGWTWRDWLARELGRHARHVGNGVDTRRYSPARDSSDIALRARLNLPIGSTMILAIGGVEERKNTIRLLEAFRTLHSHHRSCRLVIAGGASILDHDAYQARFAEALAQSDLPEDAVIRSGPLPQELMPALYRGASSLVFPSTKEGFGLVVLEAMACGVPVVTSRIAPFTEYLGDDDVVWCDPFDPASIAVAMRRSLDPSQSERLAARGPEIARRHDWTTAALAHLRTYNELASRRGIKEPCCA